MTDDYDSSVRQMLVTQVATTRVPSRRRFLLGSTIAFVLSGAVAGGTVAAIADSNGKPQPYTLSPPTTEFDHRETQFFSETIVTSGVGDESINLGERPEGATEVTFEFQCTSPGTFRWGIDEVLESMSYRCEADQFINGKATGSTRYVFRDVDAGPHTIEVEALGDASWGLTATWAKQLDVRWQTNDRGQTFGIAMPGGATPDLIAATGVNASGDRVDGYLVTADFEKRVDEYNQTETTKELPLVASDGVTELGTYRIGG